MTDFALTEHDKSSPLWLRLKDHFLDRLAIMRARNDNALLTEAETAAIRGEIKCLRGLIALDDDRPVVTGADDAP